LVLSPSLGIVNSYSWPTEVSNDPLEHIVPALPFVLISWVESTAYLYLTSSNYEKIIK